MKNLVIGIPTYKRPEQLQKLIRSIFNSTLDGLQNYTIQILVVDNHDIASAKNIIMQLQEECKSPFSLKYVNYASRGLSNVRNELLSNAYSYSPEYIVFVDDDEYVTTGWLMHLVQTAQRQNADIVNGPVIPEFDKSVSKYLQPWFIRKLYVDQQAMGILIGAGNLLMRTEFILANDLKFDLRFNLSGGEDSYFGEEAIAKGAKIFWALNAVIYEPVPKNRAKLAWLIKRKYRGATTYTYMQKIKKNYKALIKKGVVSFLYLTVGMLTLPAILWPIEKRYWSLLTIANGLGGLAGLFNITYKEYS